MKRTDSHPLDRMDLGGRMLFGLVLAITAWIMAMPLVPLIQRVTLERFHLISPTYRGWAAQQIVPSMYSFENRYWCLPGQSPPRETVRISQATQSGWLNHFPGRLVTFADNRVRLLKPGQPTCVVLSSRYRGQQVTTISRIMPVPQGGFRLERTEVSGEQP